MTNNTTLEMFKSNFFADVLLNQWIRPLPPLIVNQHLHLSASDLNHISECKSIVLG